MISAWLASSLPILVTALGALFTEASGTLNIALEGLMTAGAFAAALVGSGGPGTFLASALAGGALALCLGFVSFRMKADPFVAALAFNLAVQGVTGLVSEHAFDTKGVVALAAAGSGGAFPAIALALASALLVVLFSRTVFGLRVRAAGSNPEALEQAGSDVGRVRIAAYVVSGVAAALGGVFLVSEIDAWVPGIAAGRGWTALVAVYLGRKSSLGTVIAAIAFGIVFALANAAQAFASIPAEFSLAFPYLLAACIALTKGGRRSPNA